MKRVCKLISVGLLFASLETKAASINWEYLGRDLASGDDIYVDLVTRHRLNNERASIIIALMSFATVRGKSADTVAAVEEQWFFSCADGRGASLASVQYSDHLALALKDENTRPLRKEKIADLLRKAKSARLQKVAGDTPASRILSVACGE